ncbi:Aste57867_3332 [Aphanomyces stellatus]|uniref:Aste57867_3332 protein n=1 Tax=Aphanomyces stellatus TaxID=120398 RepID=A0A485K9F7_9STRA|nr:hypothetical protein As57867_003322 [Aphanomyces stellatus]VFT80502.1 Aste57867_3332 [Aphanomyces stellatus]
MASRFLHYWAADAPTTNPTKDDGFSNCTIPAYANLAELQLHVIQRYVKATLKFDGDSNATTRTMGETAMYTIGCGVFGFAGNGSIYMQLWSQSVVNKNESGSWSQPE